MTLFDLGQRFVGTLQERAGMAHHPYIVWAHSLTGLGLDSPDEVPWCSSWLSSLCWLMGLPRSKSAAARSWHTIGNPIVSLFDAKVGYDIVVLNRGGSDDPAVAGPGHVGLFAGLQPGMVMILGGNQGDSVSVQAFPRTRVLAIRRLSE